MSVAGAPAIAGGAPLRTSPLPYGRHEMTDEDRAAVLAVLDSGMLTGGSAVTRFEAALAERCGVSHAVVVCNGTAALHLGLAALGCSPGDEVITSPLTFVASANAALYCGATPVFADIGADRCLDPDAVAATISQRTRAVVAVDYAGLPADVDALRAVLPTGCLVVVDAAHSLGGALRGRPVGSMGEVTTLSFHPVKHITTGEGGACLTDDADLAATMRMLRNHGMTSEAGQRTGAQWRYDVVELGYNYRITDLQAALGWSQLGRLDGNVARRTALAARYDELISELPGVSPPPRVSDRRCAWHLYAVEIDEDKFGCSRDDVIDGLRAEGIQATLHYPAAHLLSIYAERGHHTGECPRAESLCARLVTLPLFASMTGSDQDDVVVALHRLQEWASRGGG
jgi:perosamine synthetase